VRVPFLSDLARRRKLGHFFAGLPRDARILEIGCGSGWLRGALAARGYAGYVGMDLVPPADVVGDVNRWGEAGLAPASFDVVVAFEVGEHVDCFEACHDLLAPGAYLFATTPVPSRDRLMQLLERLGLNQQRTSPHDRLVDLAGVALFPEREVRIVGGLAQWGVLKKPGSGARVGPRPGLSRAEPARAPLRPIETRS
jgi:SAM-dependent methyltransferase